MIYNIQTFFSGQRKTQCSAVKTFRYIKFEISASFTVLLILKQLEKMLDIIVK